MDLAKKIKQYIEGTYNLLYDELVGKPEHFREQVLYRASKCEDCYRMGACLNCGCDLPGKHYVKESCNNGLRFPDLMEEEEWNKYKEDNDINIKYERKDPSSL